MGRGRTRKRVDSEINSGSDLAMRKRDKEGQGEGEEREGGEFAQTLSATLRETKKERGGRKKGKVFANSNHNTPKKEGRLTVVGILGHLCLNRWVKAMNRREGGVNNDKRKS